MLLSSLGSNISPLWIGIVTLPGRLGCFNCTCEPFWVTYDQPLRRNAVATSLPVTRGSFAKASGASEALLDGVKLGVALVAVEAAGGLDVGQTVQVRFRAA